MNEEQRKILSRNKVKRLREELNIAEREGDDDRYEELENQLDQAIRKLERLENK